MREPEPGRLFVYGTLRPDGSAPREARRALEAGSEPVGVARVRARLFVAGGGRYPAAVPTGADRWIRGHLYRLEEPDRVLPALDRYEGCRPDGTGLYRREVTEARLAEERGERSPRRAWIYVYNRDTSGLVEIEDGDWLAWRANRRS